jgi:3-hydroxyacyl-CoA dehydrogenase/enoyl-CoA hydratase/3-hydroxybutyryl-CoA epimerase/3-hydroxyacyl-CoA dehydrogenase/enoyl-CoA hydratase/3-hydroxybutyryl-CoA epimerase/enoyl-CoA isomerase
MFDAAIENVRWIADWGRQTQSVVSPSAVSPKIGTVGIIGAGMMGTSIAAAHVQYRFPVVVHDINAASLEHAPARIAKELAKVRSHVGSGAFQRLVRTTDRLAEVARCDLVIESIAETPSSKIRLYQGLSEHLGERTIVASNTSTIPLQQIASGIADPSRFCGLHFCHPVEQRPLVEVVHGPETSKRTLAAATAHVNRIGRIPMTVEDGPGFIVNRLLFPYLGEALELLREGVSAERIEQAAIEFGMTIGPLHMMDEIGLDTILQAAWILSAVFPERIVSSPILMSLVKAGRLGQKTGAGFFSHHDSPDQNASASGPSTTEIIAPWIETTPSHSPGNLIDRLMLPMLLEATRILEEEKVFDVREIDLAVLFGLGFPSAKGGLLWWADTLGAERIIGMLAGLKSMGNRSEPTTLLRKLAKSGGRFYTWHGSK